MENFNDYNRVMDAARARAAQLRRQAIRELWAGADASPRQAWRAASRLAQRLRRHQALRHGTEA